MSTDQRRKNTLTKMKGLVIPEVNNEAMASPPPMAASTASKLSTPPWKTTDVSSKYSPAYKRKPFTVYGNSNSTTTETKRPTTSNTIVKSDDSDNDSAVSSGRSSLSHSSVSPPASPKTVEKSPKTAKNRLSSPTETIQETTEVDNPRVLKKDSVEAINRRNILESCKKSSAKPDFKTGWNSGRPASRSSSFTIAERKKSFEIMANQRTLGESKVANTHSSQDSLSSSRKTSREYDSAFTSRRPSREATAEEYSNSNLNSNSRRSSRGSESIVDTIKDIENRVAYMSDIVNRHEEKVMKANVDDDKWSTLEKKYIYKDQEQNNERPKGKFLSKNLC